MTIREVAEGNQVQGEDESIVYTLTTTGVGSSPTSTSAKIFSYNEVTGAYTDVTSTNMSGSTSVSSDIITLPTISALVPGTAYRVEVQYTVSGNVVETFFWINAER